MKGRNILNKPKWLIRPSGFLTKKTITVYTTA